MSTLNEAIQNLPAENPSLFPEEPEISLERLPGLRIHQWNGMVWVLPWACFIGANYRPNVGSEEAVLRPVEQIELVFAHQTVVIQGRNLQSLMEAIADMSLHLLREIPQAYMEMEAANAAGDPTVDAGNSAAVPTRPRVLIASIDVQAREK